MHEEMLRGAIGDILPLGEEWRGRAQARLDSLTKPPGSLGRLEEVAARLGAIYGDPTPELPRKAIFTFAGDHGVTAEGVSAYPKEVTPQMVYNFLRGGAAINVLARHAGADVVVVDVGVDYEFRGAEGLTHRKVVWGTGNIAQGPAMTRAEALAALCVGLELAEEYAEKGYRMFGTGEMGIGNTTPSSAIAAVLTGRPVREVSGRGTGIGDEAFERKMRVIERALAVNRPDAADPLDVLAKVGGAEIAAIAGLTLGGAARDIPVVVDGFISTAGAAIAGRLAPGVREYVFAAHRSVEAGHGALLDDLGASPLLDLRMRLGEGTGAALAMTLLDAALKVAREMATFGEAGVSEGGE
jgi:nicotinate-nucleotide--dimethylbenzimidazole phosphoribosyltransferase